MSRKTPGIEIRHDRNCPAREGKRCACSPGYRAEAHSPLDKRRVRKTFRTLAEANRFFGSVRRRRGSHKRRERM